MNKKILLLFTFFACFFIRNGMAQQNYTLYNMHRIPQSMYANPAGMPLSKVNIGLPVISSVYLNVSNNGFKPKDVIVSKDDSLYISPSNLISKLGKNNYLNLALQTDILSFGFRVKKSYFSFNATEKVLIRFRYPLDFMQFVWQGNAGPDVIGRELKFNFGVDATHYREYGIGFAHEFFDRLSIGIRGKYLYGMENISTQKSDVTFKTDSTNFDLTATSDVIINSSGIDQSFKKFNITDELLHKKNRGFGGDLGVDYRIFDFLSLSASIVDIGYIAWKTDVSNFRNETPGASYTFRGIAFEDIIRDTASVEDGFIKGIDSIANTFKFITTHQNYATFLSPQIYLAGNFHFTRRTNVGLIYHSQFFDKQYHPGFSANFNTMAGRALSFSASYSVYSRSFNNVGLGLALNLGPAQVYMVSDNVLGMIFPASTKNINLRFGSNLTFGKMKERDKKDKIEKPWEHKEKKEKPVAPKKVAYVDTDHDSIPDSEDACPEIFGLKYLNGCPDRDHDSIADKDDLCPDVFGLAVFHGCPDTDRDGIEDKLDSCPTVSGLSQFNGCPDTDGDEIEDRNDSCPTVAGLIAFHGCPDTDGDGIIDKEDQCPKEAGPIKFHGCPDKDGDGIPDKDDECPDRPGLMAYFGCPDTDLDGVPDNMDDCPETYGSKENHGCPLKKVEEKFKAAELTQKEQEVLKTAFDNLTFQSGKAAMAPGSLASLDELATMMKGKQELKLYVSGHTDNSGNAATNQKLSENRAKAVKTYLASKGVNPTQVTTEGFGSTRPIAENTTPDGKAKNRRVELKIIK